MTKKSFLTILLFTKASFVLPQISVEARLDSSDILIGEQVHLQTKVITGKGKIVKYPDIQPRTQLINGVEIVEVGAPDTTFLSDGKRMELRRNYTLTAFDSALYYIPPFEVTVDEKIYRSQGNMGLKVSTVPVDTVHVDRFAGPNGVVNEAFVWSPRLFLLSLLLCVIVAAIFWLVLRLSDCRPRFKRVIIPPKTPPHQVAMSEIDRIKRAQDTETAGTEGEKNYYVALTDVLRGYIYERFGIDAREMTSAEIIAALTEKGDATALRELREIFETADLVKFAKHRTTFNEKDRSLVQAVDFVNQTKVEPLEAPRPIVQELPLEERVELRRRRWLQAAVVVLFGGGLALAAYLVTDIYNCFL